MLQIDAVPAGVTLKDAEATLFIPGTKQQLSLTLGQMKWPFGYEGPQSSSDREFPERSRVVRDFLPDERDRGAKVSGQATSSCASPPASSTATASTAAPSAGQRQGEGHHRPRWAST